MVITKGCLLGLIRVQGHVTLCIDYRKLNKHYYFGSLISIQAMYRGFFKYRATPQMLISIQILTKAFIRFHLISIARATKQHLLAYRATPHAHAIWVEKCTGLPPTLISMQNTLAHLTALISIYAYSLYR